MAGKSREDDGMKRALLGFIVLAVCGMMVGPVAMAGKPGGGEKAKYSTISNDIVAGPTQDSWTNGVNWYVLDTQGGPITVNDATTSKSYDFNNDVDPDKSYMQWETHGEVFIMFDAKGNWLNPHKMKEKTYTLPNDPAISDLHFSVRMMGVPNPDEGPEEPVTIVLWIFLDLHRLPDGEQLTLTITAGQVQLSGTDVTFIYDCGTGGLNLDNPRYGTTQHSFELAIDK